MRQLTTILLITLSLSAFGQRRGNVTALPVDTVKGAETIYFTLPEITGTYSTLTFEAKCTEVGGTADGYVFIQAAADYRDANWVTLGEYNWLFEAANDSLDISNGAVGSWVIAAPPYNAYRFVVIGTSGDTTKITPKYLLK